MRKHLSTLSLLLGLAAFAAIGCGDDDESNPTGTGGGGGGTTTTVDLTSAQVEIPSAMQTAAGSNPGAAQAVGAINLANSFTAYSSWWTPPSGIKDMIPTEALGADTIISWSQGELTIILELTPSGSVTSFAVTIDGFDGDRTYDSFIFLQGFVMNDGSEGNLGIKNPDDPGSNLLFWQWLVNPNNVFILDLISSDDEGYLTVMENPDGSGSVTQEFGQVLSFEADWTAGGGGTYTIYDGQGQPTQNGSW